MHIATDEVFSVMGDISTSQMLGASDYRANGLLLDYIGWTNGLSDYRAK